VKFCHDRRVQGCRCCGCSEETSGGARRGGRERRRASSWQSGLVTSWTTTHGCTRVEFSRMAPRLFSEGFSGYAGTVLSQGVAYDQFQKDISRFAMTYFAVVVHSLVQPCRSSGITPRSHILCTKQIEFFMSLGYYTVSPWTCPAPSVPGMFPP
jgi:hypothetical protein